MLDGGQELRQKLSAVRGNHIISGMCDMWQGKSLRVPRLRPTLVGCDIIKVDYALMVSGDITRGSSGIPNDNKNKYSCSSMTSPIQYHLEPSRTVQNHRGGPGGVALY